jgi:DsbC/DsbD-like thiol-disulfide interchange protein
MVKSFQAVCVGFVLTVGALAGATSPTETKHLTVAPSTPTGPVAPGARVTLTLDVTPKRTMHVYAPEPKAAGGARTVPHGVPEGFIPVSLKIDPDPAIAVGPIQFPKPERRNVLGEDQLVYSAPFRIAQDVTVAATPAVRERARTAGGTVTVKGTLRYQACDDAICYVPVNVPVTWTVALERPAR